MNRENSTDDLNYRKEEHHERPNLCYELFDIVNLSLQLAGYHMLICLLIVAEGSISAVGFFGHQGRRLGRSLSGRHQASNEHELDNAEPAPSMK